MLYNPPHFKVEDEKLIHDHITRSSLATLVTAGRDGAGPLISHLPMLLEPDAGQNGRLIGHLARANPHWQSYDSAQPAVAIFHGPDAYISPSWYPSKFEHGRVVPTWNYAVVHARGRLQVFEEADRLLDVVERLTNAHEGTRAVPWQVSDAPERFTEAQLRGIVGVTLEIETLEGKHKLSQNRNETDRNGVRVGLATESDEKARAVRELMDGGG